MKSIIITILTIVLATVVNSEYISYKNYKVYNLVPKTDSEVKLLKDLKNQNEYEFWSDVVELNKDVKILVGPETQNEFENYFENAGITTAVAIEDVQEEISNQLRRPSSRSNTYKWDYYLTLSEINAWMDKLVQDYPNIVSIINAGNSTEGRTIRGVKIDFKKIERPMIGMIEGGIHAREWISPATVTYIINEFLTSTDPNVRLMAEDIVWHVFPVINPDGYEYTFSSDRMWRKNRNTANFTSCGPNQRDDLSNGIDLNRNFGFVWMSTGASQNPCDQTFAGPVAFSEPESRGIANYVLKIKNEGHMIYYLAFHSYSQMLLVPYSHVGGGNVLEVPNYGDLFEIGMRGMDKLEAKHGTPYIVGTSADILYEVSGSSFDWARGVADIPIVFLFELRDLGQYGFLLPPEQIIPNNEEVMAGLVEMDQVTRRMGRYHYASSGNTLISSLTLFALLVLLIN